jgi:hemin uptake protein HemP
MKVITNLTAEGQIQSDAAILAEQAPNTDIKLTNTRRLNTNQLFTDVKEVVIEHLNETYVLRITKQNKLILTK